MASDDDGRQPEPGDDTAGEPMSGSEESPEAAAAAATTRRRKIIQRVGIVALASLLLAVTAGVVLWRVADARINDNIEWLGDIFDELPTRPPTAEPEPGPTAMDPGSEPTEAAEPEPEPPAPAEPPVNILLLGSDSRTSAGDPSQWEYGAQRTDAILLVHIPSDRERAFVMSIPRDSWVAIPGHGEAKINAAFAYGGPALMVQTFEQLTGIRLDHVVVSDFESFARITDHFGGVEITIPETTYDRRRGEWIPAGTYEMNGEEALDYVRQRYGLPGGDFDRVRRHQNWLKAILAASVEQGIRDNPVKLTQALLVISESIAADDGFTVSKMRELALSTRPIDEAKDVTVFTAPYNGTGTSADGQSIVVLNRERLAAVCAAIAAGDAGQFLADHPGYLHPGEYVR